MRDDRDDVGTLVVIGHNPTIGLLAQLLDDGDGRRRADAVDRLFTGYPTSAVAVFEYRRLLGRIARGGPGWRRSTSAAADADLRPAGAGVTMPTSASAASISSREMPSRYMIASR